MAEDPRFKRRRDARHQGDPQGRERQAPHRLGRPVRPMRGDGRFDSAPTGVVKRVGVEPVDDDGVPVDINMVRRDDALIEALAAGGSVNTTDDAEFELASLLADWRDEIVDAPIPASPTVDEILAASAEPDRRAARRRRRFAVIAGAAAAAVALAGVSTVFVRGAEPGDRLWSAKEVMFAQAASQTLATSEAKAQIGSARTALDSGDTEAVSAALAEAKQRAAAVTDTATKDRLEQQIRALAERAGVPTPGASPHPSASGAPTTPTSVTVTSSVNPTIMLEPPTSTGHSTPTSTVGPTTSGTTTVPSATATSGPATTTAPSGEATTTAAPTATSAASRTTTTAITTTTEPPSATRVTTTTTTTAPG